MIQALLQDQLVELQVSDNLLEPFVLLLTTVVCLPPFQWPLLCHLTHLTGVSKNQRSVISYLGATDTYVGSAVSALDKRVGVFLATRLAVIRTLA